MKRTEQPSVITWADSFGVWHARVLHDRNPEAAAQVAIWKEIQRREGPTFNIPLPYVAQDSNDAQVWHEVDVMETSLDDCIYWSTNERGDCGGRVEPVNGVLVCETCRNRK